MKLRTKITWSALVAAALLVGLGLIVLFSLPYETSSALVNRLARDERVDQFSRALVEQAGPALRLAGGLLALVGLLMLAMRRRSLAWVERLLDLAGRGLRRLTADGQVLVRGLRPEPLWGAALVGLMAAAGFSIFPFLSQAMGHDEAYTFMSYARQSLGLALSDYSLPNNHLFHTFWLYLSTHLFGTAPWAVRLPAFVAGILLIPAVYGLGVRLYSKPVGLAAAVLVTVAPEVQQYASVARGYTLLALLAILLFQLSWYVREHHNSAAWALWCLVAALGFYTVPVFLYPFGAAAAWIFFSILFGDYGEHPNRWKAWLWLVVSGCAAGVLTLLLYLPVVLYHRTLQVLFGNVFIQSLSWDDFLVTAPIRLQETWQSWTAEVPVELIGLLIAGLGLSILLHWKLSATRVPAQLAALAWFVAIALYQHTHLWGKTWFFLHPLILLWCAAGIVGLAGLVSRRFPRGRWVLGALALLALSWILSAGLGLRASHVKSAQKMGLDEQFVLAIKPQLQDGDIIISNWMNEPAVWYYMAQHQIPEKILFIKALPFKRAYVIVNHSIDQNLPDVINDRRIDLKLFNLGAAVKVQERSFCEMYLVPVK